MMQGVKKMSDMVIDKEMVSEKDGMTMIAR